MVSLLARSFTGFLRDNGLMLAGSMSYFTMMALVPFCMFLITLLDFFLDQYPDFYKFFIAKLISFFPAVTQEMTDDLKKIISHKGIGKYSLLLYGFLSFQVFVSMETALNAVFKIKKRRHMVISLLISIIVITFIIVLLIASFAAASIIPLIKTLSPNLPWIRMGKIAKFLLQFVLPFILVFFSIAMLYLFVPKVKVKISSAFGGALFATVFLEIAKHFFTWYAVNIAQFGRIYGPLSAFVMFLLWMFYSSSIFLIGAEIVHNLSIHNKTGAMK